MDTDLDRLVRDAPITLASTAGYRNRSTDSGSLSITSSAANTEARQWPGIGTKNLGTIRKEIEKALASSSEDPIQCLDRQIAHS